MRKIVYFCTSTNTKLNNYGTNQLSWVQCLDFWCGYRMSSVRSTFDKASYWQFSASRQQYPWMSWDSLGKIHHPHHTLLLAVRHSCHRECSCCQQRIRRRTLWRRSPEESGSSQVVQVLPHRRSRFLGTVHHTHGNHWRCRSTCISIINIYCLQ